MANGGPKWLHFRKSPSTHKMGIMMLHLSCLRLQTAARIKPGKN